MASQTTRTPLTQDETDRLPDQPTRGEQATITREDIFTVLSNERRRYVLEYLKRHPDRTVELRELVEYVAEQEYDAPIAEVDSGQRKATYAALRQTHLPKLYEYGVVEYDRQRGEVELTEQASAVQVYLEYVPEEEIPWSYFYLGLTVLTGSALVLAWTGLPPFASVSEPLIAAGAVVLFGVSSAVHLLQTTRNQLDVELDY